MSGIQGMAGGCGWFQFLFFFNNKRLHHDITTIVKIVDQC